MNKDFIINLLASMFIIMVIVAICMLVISIIRDVEFIREKANSYKDVVCAGVVVLSGNGYVYKDGNTYILAGKTYQMKDGETCWINDSHMNVEVK